MQTRAIMALDANRKKMPIILPTTCCFPYKFLVKIVKNCWKAGALCLLSNRWFTFRILNKPTVRVKFRGHSLNGLFLATSLLPKLGTPAITDGQEFVHCYTSRWQVQLMMSSRALSGGIVFSDILGQYNKWLFG